MKIAKWVFEAIRNIALIIVGLQVVLFLWSFFISTGEITQGGYRGIQIGDTRAEVLSVVMSPYSPLKLSGYEQNNRYEALYSLEADESQSADFASASKWYLTRPSVHKEIILLDFGQDNRVELIRFRRDALSP